MLILILIVIVLLLFYIQNKRSLSYWKNLGVKQTNPLPFFGDVLNGFLGETVLRSCQKLYNLGEGRRFSGCYQLDKPVLCVRDPDLLKQMMVKDFEHFADHQAIINNDADPLWGKNLFSLQGHKWKEMRVTLTPAFTSSKMKFMFGLINEVAEDFTNYFVNQDESFFDLELKDTISRFTNDVIATTAFGIKVNSIKDKDNEFYQMGKDATTFTKFSDSIRMFINFVFPKLALFLKLGFFSAKVAKFFRGLIKNTIELREKNNIVRPDMIHLLMEARKESSDKLTDDEITAQCLAFFFGGFDTVSGASCFALYELALNQDLQDSLREEINQTYEDNNGKLTYEVIKNMRYMDMVVQETLRKWPPFATLPRICTKDYTFEPVHPDEKPVPFKVDDLFIVPIYAIQRDPKYFPNPDKFDPERFSEENKDKIVPYTFIPFGVGPRFCIGSRFALLEIKIILFYLLRQFRIVPNEKSEIPVEVHPRTFSTTAKNGFHFRMEKIVD